MKALRLPLLAATCLTLAAAAPAASPVLLVRDNFDAATANVNDLNVDLARQTGALAPLAYTMAFGSSHYGHQLQNVNAQNQLLVADFPNSTVSLNFNFNAANSAGGLKISFDVDSMPSVYASTADNWGCINLGLAASDQLGNVNQGVPHFGILFRAAGTVQAFDGSSVVNPPAEPVYSARPPGSTNHIDLIISDTDGNPFDGTGNTTIEVFANGGAVPVYSFTKTGGYANNYINLQGSYRAHFDNLEISRLDPAIENPSFEANSFTVFPGYHHQPGNGAIVGWTPSGGAGLNPASGSPFADNGVVPHGSQVAFIQNGADSFMRTVIPNLTVGQAYKVNFRVNARSGNTPNLKVAIDADQIINTAVTAVGGANPYKYFAFDFTATATSQTLTLRNDAGGDNTVVLDDFSIATRNSGWSYAAWNDDATSGVDSSKTYTHAYNLGSATDATINGIVFRGVAGGNPSVANKFSTAALPNVLAPDANNVTGGSRQLADDFLYGGPAQSITLNGLIVGGEYVTTIYSVGWEDGTRAATFSVGNDRLTVNQDHFGNNNGIRFIYRFFATDTSVTLHFDQLEGNSIHVYGFSNLELSTPNNIPPSITAQPQDLVVGLGDTATFTVSATGSAPLTYQWYFGADALPGANAATLNVLSDFPDVAGNYSVIVTNNAGSITSRVARLTVRARVPGLFNTGVDDFGVALADGAVDPHYKLIVNADGPSTDAIVENSAAFPIVGGPWVANNASGKWIGPRFDTAAAAGLATGGGVYVYRQTFDLTGLDRSSIVITGGWAVDNEGQNIRVNGVDTGIINGNGFGSLTPFTLNSANAMFVDGVNTLDFVVRNVDVEAGYTGLRVADLRGLAELPGTPPTITTQPQSQVVGTGESISFSVIASGSSPLGYQWRKNGAAIPGATSAVLPIASVVHGDAGIYSVVVSNAFGTVPSDNATLTVRDTVPGFFNTGVDASGVSLPSGSVDPHWRITQSSDPAFPGPDALVLSDSGFPIPPWLANDVISKWIAPQASQATGNLEGDYTYRSILDLTGFDPASVRVTGEWATDNAGTDILINGVSTGQRNDGQFVVWTPFHIDSGFVAGLNTVDFKVNNAGPGVNPTGFRAQKLRALGTALPLNTPPFILVQPQDRSAVFGEIVVFKVVANGSVPLSYQWFFGPDALPGETGPTLTVAFDFPDQTGDYHVVVSNDAGSVTSDPATLSAPNEPPSFTKGPDQTVPEDAGPKSIVAWASNIDPGAFNETGQVLTFLVSNSNPGLFAVQPSISPGGTLVYESVANASGVATVTVVLMDDGGTANGGMDRSPPTTFVITVTPVNDCPVASPLSLSVAQGSPTNFSLVATDVEGDGLLYTVPSPPLHGTLIFNVVTGAASYTPDANYCGPDSFKFQVTDFSCPSAEVTVLITVRCPNQPPTAVVKLAGLCDETPGLDHLEVISANGSNGCVVLDGSMSSDPDNDTLTYHWLLDGNPIPFATGAVVTNCLELGEHTILLMVDDGRASGTTTATVNVITGCDAVENLIRDVNDANLVRKNKRPLIASLKGACASFDRGSFQSGANQLEAFLNKVRAQIARQNPAEADQFTRAAQKIIDAMECGQ